MKELFDLRTEAGLKKYPTIDGCDSFRAMIFVCDSCLIEYGSCPLFTQHQLQTYTLYKIYLCSDVVELNGEKEDNSNASEEFILPDSYCSVAPDSSSPNNIWFIKIINTLKNQCRDY